MCACVNVCMCECVHGCVCLFAGVGCEDVAVETHEIARLIQAPAAETHSRKREEERARVSAGNPTCTLAVCAPRLCVCCAACAHRELPCAFAVMHCAMTSNTAGENTYLKKAKDGNEKARVSTRAGKHAARTGRVCMCARGARTRRC